MRERLRGPVKAYILNSCFSAEAIQFKGRERNKTTQAERFGIIPIALAVWHAITEQSGRELHFAETPRVQVPNNHILSKILTYITTILKPSTSLLGPLDPWGLGVCTTETSPYGFLVLNADILCGVQKRNRL